jgi:hypothetical protein
MSLSDLFCLKELEINYVSKINLNAWSKKDAKEELSKNYRVYYDTVMAHHFPFAKKFMIPGVNGHHHVHQSETINTHDRGSFEWHQLGGGHKKNASYCDGETWSNGFMICHVDTLTRKCLFEYVDVQDFAVVGGKYYYRQKQE